MDINTCLATTSDLRTLSLYAHIVPAFSILVFGLFTVVYARSRVRATIFLLFTLVFSLWLFGDAIAWGANNYYLVATVWSTLDFLNIVFYLLIFYLIYYDFFEKKYIGIVSSAVIILSIIPFIITISGLSVSDFDHPNCEMLNSEFLGKYKLFIDILTITGIATIGILRILYKNYTISVKRTLFTIVPIIIFLVLFSSTEYFASTTGYYEINLYILLLAPFFVLSLMHNLVEDGFFRLSSSNLFLVRLFIALFICISILNVIVSKTFEDIVFALINLLIIVGFIIIIIKSANREIKQREEIEKLALNLKRANERLRELDKMKSEFVSLASHQLRSPLTSIRGFASMMLEGSFGKLPPKALEATEHIAESSKSMALSVEDYLNVSRIESGNMKYNMVDFNLREQVERVVDDIRISAMKKGLLITFKSDLTKQGMVNADLGKTQQILHNLLNNSTKYTPKGSIDVVVHDNVATKEIYVDITDTGIGMSAETINSLFAKFSRATNAHKVNVHGTGLGLYIARVMAQNMHGDITASSPGEGQGSTFRLTLPCVL